MADRVNEVTLKLAKFLLQENGSINMFTISGFVAYLTLSLLNIGLRGPSKYQISDFLGCNFTFMEISEIKDIQEYGCSNLLKMDEFNDVGRTQTAIFHSIRALEDFKQMALENYNIELIPVPRGSDLRHITIINQWAKNRKDIPYGDTFIQPFRDEISSLIIDDNYIRFNWEVSFREAWTSKGIFTNNNGKNIVVDTMILIEYLYYLDDNNTKASILFLPCDDYDTFSVIVLPHEETNLVAVLKRMKVPSIAN
ncbi:hypothetical protein RF11_07551 [Thelohanellus kitauei]|uniref:Serpin domain-containing protein n=1 Tax=Thelohanellus kitauei TaxID=669202 RepID=A0A0C2MZE8_THEKT|nr:hypothetical protein RF11_07551 [Thelohanellus kitauei]